MYEQDTIVAPATPPGQGAVAIVRLAGPRAIEILHRLWRPARATEIQPRRLYLGEIRDPVSGASIDRTMAVLMPGPASLTGEDVAELQCHGGAFLVRRVLGLAIAEGARMAERGEFSRRAFLNGRLDLTEAEAVADLVSAEGEGALQQAINQLGGALKHRVCGLRREVIGIKAHLEVEIDFSDEDLKLPGRDQIGSQLERLAADVQILHDSFARGRLMREGARAAIIGKPNAGKSTILNLLLGIERAIVTPYPGTTRDVIEDSIQLGAYPLVLQDTAGIRDGTDPVERIGVERALHHAGEADLLIAVFDSSRPIEDEDLRVLAACGSRAGVAILNKSDLPAKISLDLLRERGLTMPALVFSAIRADGVAALRDELARILDALAGDHRGDAVAVSRERHRRALASARTALEAAIASVRTAMPPEIVAVDVTLAAEALGAITGEVSSEDVLDAVFAEFCIGK